MMTTFMGYFMTLRGRSLIIAVLTFVLIVISGVTLGRAQIVRFLTPMLIYCLLMFVAGVLMPVNRE
ncbi:MAG: hypothetical protein ACPG7F_10260 [Aggregatilineales bacterium]